MLHFYDERAGKGLLLATFAALLLLGPARAQGIETLTADRDNTLYESAEGTLSNGSGVGLFSGRTNQSLVRRALLHFDPSGLPDDAVIDSVALMLNMSNVAGGAPANLIGVHRVLADWGEGDSEASGSGGGGGPAAEGDATWLHTFFDATPWDTPGGDFVVTPSATLNITALGGYTWKSDDLAADVQAWLDTPEENFGWILVGDELANQSARRFDSREAEVEAVRPMLTVYYTSEQVTATDPTPVPSDPIFSAYPTPFASQTTLSYTLPAAASVTLTVYDVLGRRMALLASGEQAPGAHRYTWDAVDRASGVYLARLEITDATGTHAFTRLLTHQ